MHLLVAPGVLHSVKSSSRIHSGQIVNRIQGISSYCACERRNVVCQLKASREDGGNQTSVATSLTGNVSEAVQSFPWEKAGRRFVERMIDLGSVPFKWVMPPLLAVSAVREILFTLLAKKDLLIPLGMLAGFLIAKVVGNAFLDVQFQDGTTTWPLVVMFSVFLVMKLPGPYYPTWAALFLPHVANAGLVQTLILLYRQQKQEST